MWVHHCFLENILGVYNNKFMTHVNTCLLAWRQVFNFDFLHYDYTATTIKNCYVHCDFSSSSTVVAETEDISILPPAEWNAVVSESGISFEDFFSCDDGIITAGTLSDDEIIDSVAQKTDTNDLDDIEDVNSTCTLWVSIEEARTALNTLRVFIEQTSSSEDEKFSALYRLDNAIDREQPNYLKQKKILTFLCHIFILKWFEKCWFIINKNMFVTSASWIFIYFTSLTQNL